jgi:preprotein translocase subunit SecG
MLKIILDIILVIAGVILTIIVLLQEGKSAGLSSSIGGNGYSSDTYWSKNKGRSREGRLEKSTKFLVFTYMVVALVLNIGLLK